MRYTDPDGKFFFAVPLVVYAALGLAAIAEVYAIKYNMEHPIGSSTGFGLNDSGIGSDVNFSKKENNQSNVGNSLKKNAQAPSAAACSPSPNENNDNDDNNNEPKFKNSNETAKEFNTNTKNYERNIKKQILKDSRTEAKTDKQLRKFLGKNDNPDIGTDKNGNIWLKSRTSNEIVKTPLKVNMYN